MRGEELRVVTLVFVWFVAASERKLGQVGSHATEDISARE